ncbi:hypothetical protein VJI72_08850, partial [Parvimonas micra]|uniref:hypothetical protein n=1 Tax=Parvimonas micra TaxID=33033 RepID=UPI002B45E2B3
KIVSPKTRVRINVGTVYISTILNEYQTAFRIPSARFLLLFRKKLTVTGISGNTQGVIIASKPVTRQIRKIFHNESSEPAA